MDVGKKIKELRKSRNLSQKELAELLDVSRAAVSHYERNIRQPRIEFFQKIARVFEVDVETIIGNNEGPVVEDVLDLVNEDVTLVLDGKEITKSELNRVIQLIRTERSLHQRNDVVKEMYSCAGYNI